MAGTSMNFTGITGAALTMALASSQSLASGYSPNNIDVPRDTAHHIQVADTGIHRQSAEERFGNFRVVLQNFDKFVAGVGTGGPGGQAPTVHA